MARSIPRLLAVAWLGCALLHPARAADERACDFDWSLVRERGLFEAPDLSSIPSGGSMPARADGSAAALNLKPAADIAFVFPPERQPEARSFAGVVRTSVDTTGLYQVTLSDEAWIDVSQDGKTALSPVAHTGRRACAGLRKSLRFRLQAGPVTIQISNAKLPQVRVSFAAAE